MPLAVAVRRNSHRENAPQPFVGAIHYSLLFASHRLRATTRLRLECNAIQCNFHQSNDAEMSSLPNSSEAVCRGWRPTDGKRRAAIFRTKLLPITALVSLLYLPAVAGPLKGNPASSATDGPESPIKIGALLPFSGGVELYGEQAKLGIDLAAQEINSQGGVLGHPLEIIYVDDGTRPDIALNGARKLIEQDGALAVIGPITSQNLNALAQTMQDHKTPLLYATNYEGGQSGRYFFALSTVPNQDLGQLLPYMGQTFGKTFYLLGADRVWPHKMFEAAEPVLSQIGAKIIGKEYTLGQEKDFTPLINRIADSQAKILLLAWKGDGLEQFISQASDQGLFKKVAVAFLGLSETDLPLFHGKGENMFVVVPFVATSDAPGVRSFMDRARARGGADAVISNYVVTHYDAVMAVKAALEKAGKVDKEEMVDALEGLSLDTPTGVVTIGRNHHSTMNMVVAKTDKGALVTTRDLGEIEPQTPNDLSYITSAPPLEVTFGVAGGHYSGAVTGGSLFLQTDITDAPLVRFSQAKPGKLYTLMMLDFDGNASGSWPDKVAPGKNAPVRHWIVGNIPGALLRTSGYSEDQQTTPIAAGSPARSEATNGVGRGSVAPAAMTVLQAYRYPHIPVVSDRYGIYLFEQEKRIEFDPVPDPITNFDYRDFINKYRLSDSVASNWFVAIYTSEQPFSGKPFHGNDVSATWHHDLGKGDLGRER
jgi:urea transport system substrate-binding protein